MITGGEIIFLWVARMVMLGLHFMHDVPFSDVVITPTRLRRAGRKMSKSLGNVIDPMELAESYGADAFRISILRQMRLESQEIRYQESRCEEARNFNNKIWNATRYILALPEGLPGAMTLPPESALTLADRWILTRLRETIVAMSELLEPLRLRRRGGNDLPLRLVRVLRLVRRGDQGRTESSDARRRALLRVEQRDALCSIRSRPFITEEVWLALPHDGQTIVTATWPDPLEVPAFAGGRARFRARCSAPSSGSATCAPRSACTRANA